VPQDGNRLISIQTAVKEGVKSTKVVRDFSDERVVQTMEIIGTDVTCTQVIKNLYFLSLLSLGEESLPRYTKEPKIISDRSGPLRKII